MPMSFQRSLTALLGAFIFGATPALLPAQEAAPAPAAAIATAPAADQPAESLTREMYRRIQIGRLNVQSDKGVVDALIHELEIPITYEHVATLLRTPNAFGDGPACVVCHSSNDPRKGYRGLDLSSCEGLLRGATESPARPLIVPGQPEESLLIKKLRNNRMPLGVPFLHPTDGENIIKVKGWIAEGAPNDERFTNEILPLFTQPDSFGSPNACVSCHSTFRDPPSFNEVNLTSHEAIMKGAWSRTRGKEGKPGIPIVIPFHAEQSPLYQRLTENRMPPGIDPGQSSDHPNTRLLMRWIEQGAWCK